MSKDLVVGIDTSTTATKAIAWTAQGDRVAEGRCAIPLSSPAANRYEQDPLDWWRSNAEALRQLIQTVSAGRIAAIAIANQRETFVPVRADGSAVRPAIIWLDERCKAEVPWLADRVGQDLLHRVSGKPRDWAPVIYRLAWMLRHEPDLYAGTALFADVHAYLVWHLTDTFRTSWASADPFGLFDMKQKTWSLPLLQAIGLTAERLPEALAPGTVLGEVTQAAAAQTGLLPGTPVVAGGGDGQAAGLGVNALSSERAYLNLGTAVVSGTYARDYLTDNAWRTMCSCSREGYYFETSLRSGTFLIDWFVRRICSVDPAADPGIYARLEAEAGARPIGSRGLLLVPYWSGVMNPYWEPDARGCMIGFSATHDRGHLYRALLEGIALEQAMVTGMIEKAAGLEVAEYVAIGGGSASELWCQIIANASGKAVRRSTTAEASSLGAAMCAAVGANWFPGMRAAADAMSGTIVRETPPVPEDARRYAELLAVYRDLYPRLRDLYPRMARFGSDH